MSASSRSGSWTRRRALALAAIAAPAWWCGAPRAARAAAPISIAVSSTPHAALLHLAAARGFFADEGLDVRIKPVSHGKAALDLLSRGEVDLAAAAEVPIVVAILRGQPLGIAATVVSTSTEMAVVARRDRGIATPRDLLNRRIGVTLGTSGEYFLWAFLIRHRLPPDAVTLVDLPPARLVSALAEGEVDAAALWQPVRRAAERALAGASLSFTAPDAYTVTHVVVGRTDYFKSHREAAAGLVRALLRAERFSRDDPQAAQALVGARMKLDAEGLRSDWQALELRVDLQQSQLITLEDEARWAMARGYAPAGPMPNFLPHLYLDALLAVQPERVTVVR